MGVLKVNTIQLENGNTPTAADLSLNTSGTILQVGNAVLTEPMSVGTSSWTDITNLSVALTPKSTNSKFILCPAVSISCDYFTMAIRILRDGSTQNDYLATNVGSKIATTAHVNPYKAGDTTGSNSYQAFYVSGGYADNTSASDTTTSITWKVQAWCYNGGQVNRGDSESDSSSYNRSTSSFLVYEVEK